jgi:SAM-dependent methyltransferase
MRIHRIRTYDEFLVHSIRNKQYVEQHRVLLQKLVPETQVSFTVPGYSYTAGKQVDFLVDFQHSGINGEVNWRERVCCPETYFNNRMRATLHLFDLEMEPYPDSKIYITEQVTPIYAHFAGKFPSTVGSEFLGDQLPFGNINKNGVRNETLCGLSFADQSFDTLLSFDVLEHIPDYEQAFRECARVLKDGGKMMWSVPFIASSRENVVRAKIENGEIVHILPPEYHGDPLSSEGVLCFTHFGWQMLDQIRTAGFRDAYALYYHSNEFAYLGDEQFMFLAIK